MRDLWPVWFSGDANLATARRRRDRHRDGRHDVLDRAGRDRRLRARHLLHGVPLDAGTAARVAAADPVAAAIRVPGRAAGVDRRHGGLRRLQRLQRRAGRAGRATTRRRATHRRTAKPSSASRCWRWRWRPSATTGSISCSASSPIACCRSSPCSRSAHCGSSRFHRRLLQPGSFRTIPFLVQFFAAAAYQLSWSIYVSDYSRYLPPNVGVAASFAWTYIGAMVGGVWMMLVGTYAAAIFPHADVAGAMQQAADAAGAGLRLVAAGRRAARADVDLGAQLLRRLADAAQCRRLLPAAACRSRPAARGARGRGRGLDRDGARGLQEFRHALLRPAGGAAVSVYAVDGDQPRGFLLGAQVPLLGARDLQSARHLWPLELARAGRLRRRFRSP